MKTSYMAKCVCGHVYEHHMANQYECEVKGCDCGAFWDRWSEFLGKNEEPDE